MKILRKHHDGQGYYNSNLMGGGKSGGSTSGMEAAAAQSNALQERMYEESVERGTPFYEGGVEGFGTLMDYLGLQGGSSQQTDQQIRDSLTDQFTTTRTENMGNEGGAGWYKDLYGTLKHFDKTPAPNHSTQWKALNPTTTKTIEEVDYDGLNSAVDARLLEQNTGQPDYFGSLLTPFGEEQFEQDAGYQFRLDEGNKALERQLAAQGKTFSPEAAKELMNYNQGMGAQEYNTAYNRYNLDQGNVYNRLAGIAGMGQQQVAQLDQAGQSYASNVGQTNASLANAQAAAQQSKGSMFGDLGSLAGLGMKAYTTFSDRDLKTNITEAGTKNGHKLYEFNYKGDDSRYIGVMAQDVIKTNPEAVCIINGSYAVDYSRLGLEMKEVV